MTGRNPTPKEFAFSGAILIAILTGISLFIYIFIAKAAVHWGVILLVCIGTAVFSYFLLHLLLERFIYRKIKVIYKTIHELKLGKLGFSEDKVNLGADIINDVSDEVQRWAVKKNNEISRLKELESYRKEFLGNVFHEIKTPVFSVQGYLHTLKDGAVDDHKVSKNYIEKAVKNIDRLEQIIQDLELITLKENNQLVIEKSKFDITNLLKDVFDALELQADIKDIEFGIKPSCDRPFAVLADKDKIRQVLVNLINNAIKYGKDGGSILVGIYDMNETILVEITDNGIGIEQEKLNRLFERFYRVDESRYRGAVGGSGLGLAIVKHIIDAHQQTINVRSTIGVGSTFGFTLEKA